MKSSLILSPQSSSIRTAMWVRYRLLGGLYEVIRWMWSCVRVYRSFFSSCNLDTLKPAPVQTKYAFIHRSHVLILVGEMPRWRSSTTLRLMAASSASAPSNARNDCSYHAKVLAVTFFRYRLSSMKAGGSFAVSSLQVFEKMGG